MAISLKDLVKNAIHVPVGDAPDEYVPVYGLTLLDIAYLARHYSKTLGKLVDKTDSKEIDWKEILLDTPDFCVEVLARCTREDKEVVGQLPVGLQIELLIGAWQASSIDPAMIETAVKKCLDLLSNLSRNFGSNN
ncbi:hypothetical protein [Vibrio phage LV6]|nr:hypothetical protein [Vibrio phage LV6]